MLAFHQKKTKQALKDNFLFLDSDSEVSRLKSSKQPFVFAIGLNRPNLSKKWWCSSFWFQIDEFVNNRHNIIFFALRIVIITNDNSIQRILNENGSIVTECDPKRRQHTIPRCGVSDYLSGFCLSFFRLPLEWEEILTVWCMLLLLQIYHPLSNDKLAITGVSNPYLRKE